MASFRVARRAFCTAAEAAPAPAPASRWERLKNSKAGVWCRSLLSDYKEACKEIVVGARERPLKASVYLGLLGGGWACFHTRPDQSSFQATLLDRSNQLALLSPWIRNATSDLHVQNLVKLRNQGCLRHLSLGLFSVVYSTDYDPHNALYEARCSNLSVPWRELPDRMLDVGFVGRWWVLDTKMKDFDVNEAEFKNLPGHMQATAPPGVQEVERNERLHRESWLPLTVEEEETEVRTGDIKEGTEVKAVDAKEDTHVVETVDKMDDAELKMRDKNEDIHQAQTVDIKEETHEVEMVDIIEDIELKMGDRNGDGDIKEDTHEVETGEIKEDNHEVETGNIKEDTHAVETGDIKEDIVDKEVVGEQIDEPVQLSAAQN